MTDRQLGVLLDAISNELQMAVFRLEDTLEAKGITLDAKNIHTEYFEKLIGSIRYRMHSLMEAS